MNAFDDLIGKTYEDCGNCYELCRSASERMGIYLPQWVDVCIDNVESEIKKRLHHFIPVTGTAQRGDLVWITNFGGPPHIGIFIERGVILHVSRGRRSGRIRIDNPRIKNRIAGIYRYVG